MGIRVGSRFSEHRYPEEERVCSTCALPTLHQKVREGQIGIVAGVPIFVYRDKLAFDCNHCRTKTETNVPLSLGPRPYSERFGLLIAVGVLSILYGAYAAIAAGLFVVAALVRWFGSGPIVIGSFFLGAMALLSLFIAFRHRP